MNMKKIILETPRPLLWNVIKDIPGYQKLKEVIDLELAVPIEDREDPGINFVRECYAKYEKILELAPNIFQNLKFVRPVFDSNINPVTITNKALTVSQDIEQGIEHPVNEFLEDQPSPFDKKQKPKTIFLT